MNTIGLFASNGKELKYNGYKRHKVVFELDKDSGFISFSNSNRIEWHNVQHHGYVKAHIFKDKELIRVVELNSSPCVCPADSLVFIEGSIRFTIY